MLCEECGSPLKDGDKSCAVCGTQIPEIVEKTDDIPDNQVSNGSTISDKQTLQAEPGSFVVQEESTEEFNWNLNGFPKPRKTEDIDFDWRIADTESVKDKSSEEPYDLTQELNKYFTFDKASEDFQKLLDKEYDRIKDYSPPRGNPYIEKMDLSDRINLEVASGLEPEFESLESESESKSGPESESPMSTELQPEHKPDNESQPEPEPGPETPRESVQTPPTVIPEEDIPENSPDEDEEPEVIWIGDLQEVSQEAHTDPTPEPESLPEEQTEKQPETPLWFDTNEEGVETEKKGHIGRAILILIIIVLLAEAAILGVQYFMPETKAAEKAGEINSAISETLVEWKDRAVTFFKGTETDEDVDSEGVTNPDDNADPDSKGPDDDEGQVSVTEPDTKPVADKETLIAAVSDRNKNIAAVKANESLVWKPDGKYADADIANSRPIENNHWTTLPDGEHVYYDREIVATLVDFDSRWVDYVNGGSDAVINMTKEGSQARKNAVDFSKVGKVEQTFQLLEIGEIRQGEKGFYVWTYEEIKEVQGSKTTIKKYNWIYQLEPVDGEMKIVRYYNY